MAVNNLVIRAIHNTQPIIWKWVASGQIEGAGQFPYYNFKHWAKLLGYADVVQMVRNPNNDHVPLIESIAGPHGYAIYKMLEVRNENAKGTS